MISGRVTEREGEREKEPASYLYVEQSIKDSAPQVSSSCTHKHLKNSAFPRTPTERERESEREREGKKRGRGERGRAKECWGEENM